MLIIYKIYENKYFNNLLLNLVNVKNEKIDTLNNCVLENKDYTIYLTNTNKQYDNSAITLKVFLYLCSLLTENGLNDNTLIIPTNSIYQKLGISNINNFDSSLKYLSSITYDYKYCYVKKVYNTSTNIIESYKHNKGHFKVVFSDDFLLLLNRTKQFYQVPKSLLKANIKVYKHSIFIGNYIFLHKRRNKGKKNENIISIKELVKNCPLLPKYETLPKEQRQVHRAIIKPFESNLNYLSKLLGFKWQYANNSPTNYFEFISNKIVLKEDFNILKADN